MERRELAESALRHLCDRIGVPYTTESEQVEGAWFLDTIHRNKVNIYQWDEISRTGGRGVSSPLGGYGTSLTHEQVYDRCWFADRCFTAQKQDHTTSVGCAVCGAKDLPLIGHAEVCGR